MSSESIAKPKPAAKSADLRSLLREHANRVAFNHPFPVFRDAVNAGAKAAMTRLFLELDAKAAWSASCEGLCITAADWKELKSKIQADTTVQVNGATHETIEQNSSLSSILRSEVTKLAFDSKSPLAEAVTAGASTVIATVFERLEAASSGFEGIAVSGAEWEKLKDDVSKEYLVY